MGFEQQLTDYVDRFWSERAALLQNTEAWNGIQDALSSCTEEECLYLRFVLCTLPFSDLGDTDLTMLLNCMRHALFCRRAFSWCADLPPQIFLLWVLSPRVNNEELSDCREFFYQELAARVEGLPLEQAILEVNRFCAEHVTYRSTDERTASALAVYQCGFGRCGEESVFAVNALRSVGIAARQVYAPWWSHCDDNHAWVEVWDGQGWRYLGACEPEPILDRGWFTAAASRAMMLRTRAFLSGSKEDVSFLFPETEKTDLAAEHGVAFVAVTHRYAETVQLTVQVRDESGATVVGARVSCSVLNMAAFREIWSTKTDESGTARIRLNRGSVRVFASQNDAWGEQFLNTEHDAQVTLTLSARQIEQSRDLDFFPPQGSSALPEPLSAEQQQTRRLWLEQAAEKRSQHKNSAQPLTERESQIAAALSEKDRALPIPREILDDAALAFQYEGTISEDEFLTGILPQRLSNEPLRPWRATLSKIQGTGDTPERIWQWVEREIALIDGDPTITPTPVGVLRLRRSTRAGREVLFRALCRAKGIVPCPEQMATASLRLTQSGEVGPAPGENCACFRFEHGGFVPAAICLGETPLPAGGYRFISTTRLPNGKQLAGISDFTLSAGETREIAPCFRQGQPDEMLTCRSLPQFALRSFDGEQTESARLLAEDDASLLVWLEVGREPTEHILQELAESSLPCALHFVLETKAQQTDPALQKVLKLHPDARLWLGNFGEDAAALARAMFGDPDRLPLVLLANDRGEGLYSCSGYNVGTAKLLLSLLTALS